jgi:hypothetical protein
MQARFIAMAMIQSFSVQILRRAAGEFPSPEIFFFCPLLTDLLCRLGIDGPECRYRLVQKRERFPRVAFECHLFHFIDFIAERLQIAQPCRLHPEYLFDFARH